MNLSILLLPVLLTFATAPAYSQSCGGHANHGSHGASQDHSNHQDGAPKVKATNTVCPVMGRAVKPGRDREVVVRGNYYLVCCDGCGPEMSDHYDKYFDRDGKPLNDPQSKEEKAAPAPAAHEGHQH